MEFNVYGYNFPLEDFIKNHLKGEALTWYSTHQEEIQNFEEFKERFFQRFYGNSYQYLVQDELNHTTYLQHSKITPTNYFSNMVLRARACPTRLEDEYICRCMGEQFGQTVKEIIKYQGVNNIDRFIQILEDVGQEKILEQLRESNKGKGSFPQKEKKKETQSSGQNRPPAQPYRNWNQNNNKGDQSKWVQRPYNEDRRDNRPGWQNRQPQENPQNQKGNPPYQKRINHIQRSGNYRTGRFRNQQNWYQRGRQWQKQEEVPQASPWEITEINDEKERGENSSQSHVIRKQENICNNSQIEI